MTSSSTPRSSVRLARLAAFQNPEFYEAQSLRLSTFGKPRIIGCAEEFPNHLALPRGCAEEVMALMRECGAEVKLEDKRHAGDPIDVGFQGVLRPEQTKAVEAVLAHDIGVFCAPTAFGKTVAAAAVIAARPAPATPRPFVPHSAMAEWVKGAEKNLMIDGCFLKCHGRVLKKLVGEQKVVHIDALPLYKGSSGSRVG